MYKSLFSLLQCEELKKKAAVKNHKNNSKKTLETRLLTFQKTHKSSN